MSLARASSSLATSTIGNKISPLLIFYLHERLFPFLSVHTCGYRITVSIGRLRRSDEGSIPSTRSNGPDESHPLGVSRGLAPPEISKRFIDSIPGFETNGYNNNESLNSNFLYYMIK